jgi:hypothetical protein
MTLTMQDIGVILAGLVACGGAMYTLFSRSLAAERERNDARYVSKDTLSEQISKIDAKFAAIMVQMEGMNSRLDMLLSGKIRIPCGGHDQESK